MASCRPPILLAALALLAAWTLAACASQTCHHLDRDRLNLLDQRRPLLTSPNPQRALAALSIHQDALGQMLTDALRAHARSLNQSTPIPGGDLRLTLHVDTLSVVVVDRCDHCLALRGGLSLRFSTRIHGLPILSGSLSGQLQGELPLRLHASSSGSTLTADLGDARIDRVSLDADGLPRAALDPVNAFALDGARALLKAIPTPVTLASWAPIALPGSNLRLSASSLHTFPDRRQIWIGFAANLPANPDPGLSPSPLLAEGEPIALTFTADALTALIAAMMDGDLIPDRLDDDLKPHPEGDYRVTLRAVTPHQGTLKTAFTLWHLPVDGACYAADLEGHAALTVKKAKDRGLRIDLNMDALSVTSTRGDDTLLRVGLWLRSAVLGDTLAAQARLLAADTLALGPLGAQRLSVKRIFAERGAVTLVGDLRPADAP